MSSGPSIKSEGICQKGQTPPIFVDTMHRHQGKIGAVPALQSSPRKRWTPFLRYVYRTYSPVGPLINQNKLLEVPYHVQDARAQTLKRVRRSIREEYGDQYDVEIFGSIRYVSSDLDCSLLFRGILNTSIAMGFPRTIAI